jgi:hypothetical protein
MLDHLANLHAPFVLIGVSWLAIALVAVWRWWQERRGRKR